MFITYRKPKNLTDHVWASYILGSINDFTADSKIYEMTLTKNRDFWFGDMTTLCTTNNPDITATH
jgi:hypothetical protein